MSDYETKRDAAAESQIVGPPEAKRAGVAGFKTGADWAREYIHNIDPGMINVDINALLTKLEIAKAALEFYAEFKMHEDEMYRDEGDFAKRTLAALNPPEQPDPNDPCICSEINSRHGQCLF